MTPGKKLEKFCARKYSLAMAFSQVSQAYFAFHFDYTWQLHEKIPTCI